MEEMMVLTDTLEAARSDRGGLGLRPRFGFGFCNLDLGL